MKKVSKAKCSHLGLSVFSLSPPHGDEMIAFLPAHVRSPEADTEKNSFVHVGTASDIFDFLVSRGMTKEQIKETAPLLQREIDQISVIEFVERRLKRHRDQPNPDPVLAKEDEDIFNALKASNGSFVSFDDYVAESKDKKQKPSRKPA